MIPCGEYFEDQIESGIDLVAMVKELDELRLRNAALEQQFHAADGRYSSQKRHNEKLQAALDVERATNTKHVTLLEQQLEEIKKGLTDSATVYANMLRGIIATPREFEHRAEQIATLEQQRWEMVEVLKKYGKHTALCGLVGGYGYCNCGFDEALASSWRS